MNTKERPPNILFIMADQHRADFLGAAGMTFLETPNLDRLARRGVRFTQCATNCPVCAPARIGLAAGLQPLRLGSLDNQSFLPRRVTTYYQRLRDAGYRTGCAGKLDLAKPDRYLGKNGDRPATYKWGFTDPCETEGKMNAGKYDEPFGPYTRYLADKGLFETFRADYREREARGWIKDASHDSVLPAEDFHDVYIGRRAAAWIESVPDDFPWHYFVSFAGPHDPFDPPAQYADRYRQAEVPPAITGGIEGKPDWIKKRNLALEPEETAVTRRQYAGAITAIDDQVGLILRALEKRSWAENTVIVYTSDHGEMLGDHGLYQKSAAYEGALRVPLIIAAPGAEGGRVSEALTELIDLNPTLCELAGLPPQEDLDARSLVPVLRGETDLHRRETFSAIRNFRCLRTPQHKLIDNYNAGLELYDLEEDPEERRNLAGERPEVLGRLMQRLTLACR